MSDPLLDALLEARAAREPAALVTVIGAPAPLEGALGRRLLVLLDGARPLHGQIDADPLPAAAIAGIAAIARARIRQGQAGAVEIETEAGPLRLFVEVQAPAAQIVICGAGHIAVPLAQMAALCDFEVTVIDDRAAFASRERFPEAQVRAGEFRAELRALRGAGFPPRTCLVLVTRGHQHDVDCLLETLNDPLAYVGMIGSRRRIRAVFTLLEQEQKLPPGRFDHVLAPVGLAIGARTPAEIAVAILAEIISTLRGGDATAAHHPIPAMERGDA